MGERQGITQRQLECTAARESKEEDNCEIKTTEKGARDGQKEKVMERRMASRVEQR